MKKELIELLHQAGCLIWEIPEKTFDDIDGVDLISMMQTLDNMVELLKENKEEF